MHSSPGVFVPEYQDSPAGSPCGGHCTAPAKDFLRASVTLGVSARNRREKDRSVHSLYAAICVPVQGRSATVTAQLMIAPGDLLVERKVFDLDIDDPQVLR